MTIEPIDLSYSTSSKKTDRLYAVRFTKAGTATILRRAVNPIRVGDAATAPTSSGVVIIPLRLVVALVIIATTTGGDFLLSV